MEARRKDVGFGGSENWAATSSLDNLGLLMEVVRGKSGKLNYPSISDICIFFIRPILYTRYALGPATSFVLDLSSDLQAIGTTQTSSPFDAPCASL